MYRKTGLALLVAIGLLAALTSSALAGEPQPAKQQPGDPCSSLPSHATVRDALIGMVGLGDSGGFGNNMWATLVNRDGIVCVVAFSGDDRGAQWPGSRVISAQKAYTANAFSLPGSALSTANLYSLVQPGAGAFGLSSPMDPAVAYAGSASDYGQPTDPMVGKRLGGLVVFGGGLALYNPDGKIVGSLGVSGDTSCTDHIVAWKVRDALALDYVPGGVADGTDNIIHDISADASGHLSSASGFGHPECDADGTAKRIAAALPQDFPIGGPRPVGKKKKLAALAQEEAAAKAEVVVMVGEAGDLGKVLVGSNGMTLYVLADDQPGESTCYDRCANNWPPLTVETAKVVAGVGVPGKLSTFTRTDGKLQLTYNGMALYFWKDDQKPGDATGHGIADVWSVVQIGQ